MTAADTVVASLDRETQSRLVAQIREVIAKSPLIRPRTPNGMPMRVRVTSAGSLGWVGDGAYHYTAKNSAGEPWPGMPFDWVKIADRVAGQHAWDSAIINWYDADAALGWHRDMGERDRTLPIVTISLGDSARWAIKPTGDNKPSRCTIKSGDVTLLDGPTRNYFHSIERIIPEPMFSPLEKRGRLSITIRVAG